MFSPPRNQPGYRQPPVPRNNFRQPPSFNGRNFPARKAGGPRQMGQPIGQKTSGGGLKGIFQRFFKSSSNAAPHPGGNFPSAVASAQTSGGGFVDKLANFQHVLNMAQQATPMIREYGPMIKNIPTMVSMLTAFAEAEDEDEESNNHDESGDLTDDLDIEESENEETVNDELDDWSEDEFVTAIADEGEQPKQKGLQKKKHKQSNEDLFKMETDLKQNYKPKKKKAKKSGVSTPKIFV
ncbi:VrrA/YqfQ family protein [Aquibacillus salsiterrae]|uniref:YqfQ family protein n=1 Tax=Aquibacillus salsiterrae TaxID=2950439 RepID=A0A9X4ADK1_9BACI|nr:VrrA/YqfQ family protein [Aquibacillus salsiterrae]MDC3415314.1 YqfQ family protein [Aquibacillus salsiterrae]